MTSKNLQDHKSYVLPLGKDSSVSLGLQIETSVGGGKPFKLMVDTGSVGIVIAQHALLTSDCTFHDTAKPFQLTYSSSGNSYEGTWVTAQVTFSSGDVRATTRSMNLRMATSWREGWRGEFTSDGLDVFMLGVGFDRDSGPGTLDSGRYLVQPDINPFILLEEMTPEGGMIPGYILTPSSITLGITEEERGTFDCVQLVREVPTPKPGSMVLPAPDWCAPSVNVSVDTSNIPPFLASLLVDTGLGCSIIQAPRGVAPNIVAVLVDPKSEKKPPPPITCRAQVADGEHVRLTYPGLRKPLYEYTVGGMGDAPPDWVQWGHELKDGVPFINTGRHALSAFDYLFDQQNGVVGFRFKGKVLPWNC